jgi:single-strand selective monofunctional uracil DNA glycosylase
LSFSLPVTHVYNPLIYAWESHLDYLQRYGQGPKRYVLFGMNPGPWGMAQTGVPLGEISFVHDWMGVRGSIAKPEAEHPKRPIVGWECPRSEVSGRRLWGWAKERFGTADAFFADWFVGNYCPLVFMEESGRNRTPDRLKAHERKLLLPLCDQAMRAVVEALQVEFVIGIGKFAAKRAEIAVGDLDVTIASIPHPSPANPAANKNWAGQMEAALSEAGIDLGFLSE